MTARTSITFVVANARHANANAMMCEEVISAGEAGSLRCARVKLAE